MSLEKSVRPRRTPGGPHGRLSARLAVAMAVVLGLGTPLAWAQQGQQAPAETAPQQQETPQQETPQQAPAPEGAAPPGVEMTERRFQDWIVRCGRPQGQEAEVCEMQQQQIDNEDRTVMAVAVGRVPGSSDVGLLILLPLGILLPAGVTMQIDGGGAIPLEVERCERQGCRIERLIDADLLSRLKAGTKATVFFEAFDPQGKRQRLGVPISLLGFTAALNEVTS
jgi:invasion protein IalB